MKDEKNTNKITEELSMREIFAEEAPAEATEEVAEAPAVAETAAKANAEAPMAATEAAEAETVSETASEGATASSVESVPPEEPADAPARAPKRRRRAARKVRETKPNADGQEPSVPETASSAVLSAEEAPVGSLLSEEPAEEPAKEPGEEPSDGEASSPHAEGETASEDDPVSAEENPSGEASAEEAPLEEESVSSNATKKNKKRERRTLTPVPCDGAAFTQPRDTVKTLRVDLLIALLPLLGWAVYLYGLRPLTLALLAVASACLADLGCRCLTRRPPCLDTDTVVIGVLIALGLPPTAPLWLPCLAAILAVLPVRLLLGGRLRRYMNPAVWALLVLTLLLPETMMRFSAIGEPLSPFAMTVERFTEAGESVLDIILGGGLPENDTLASAFFGLRSGRIGESSVLLILAAALYLGCRKQIRGWLSFFFLLTVGVLTYLFPRTAVASDMIALRYMGYQLMGTELLFGVFFLISDAASSPRTPRAAVLCGILGGAVTVGLRYFVEPSVAVLGAAAVIGLLSSPLDVLLCPSVFGGRRKKKKTSPVTHTPELQA